MELWMILLPLIGIPVVIVGGGILFAVVFGYCMKHQHDHLYKKPGVMESRNDR